MEQTSLDAWNDIQKDLGEKQMEVFNLFKENETLYDQKICDILGWQINRVTPRRLELQEMGLIRKRGTTISKFTGKTVNEYVIVKEVNNEIKGMENEYRKNI
jgi:hypothetical protein